MDDTTMYITEIFLNWFYRLITYVKLLIFIQAQIRLRTDKQTTTTKWLHFWQHEYSTYNERETIRILLHNKTLTREKFILCYTKSNIIHLLTGYEGNNTFIVPKVPTIFRGNTEENSWYRGDN
jgi:hypothetical protein